MTAGELCAELVLGSESLALLEPDLAPREYAERLIAAEKYSDAVTVMAHALPAREGIWWGCGCARQSPDFLPGSAAEAAVLATETWVTDGSEESRYRTFTAAQEVPLGSPANCVAMAAFACGQSMAPAGEEIVPPPPTLRGQLIAGAVTAASIAEGAAASAPRYCFFLEQGRQLLPVPDAATA